MPLDVKSWNVKANVTEVAEGVAGEDRDRLQVIPNYYDINLTCTEVGVADLAKLIESTDNDDQKVLPLDKSLAFLIRPMDGTSAAFQAHGDVTFGGWEWASSGRKDPQQLTIPIRAQYFASVQTV